MVNLTQFKVDSCLKNIEASIGHMKVDIIKNEWGMKTGSLSEIMDINKKKQRPKNNTLRDPT